MRRSGAVHLLIVLLILVGTARSKDEPPPRAFALLVGCSEYPWLEARYGRARYQSQIRLPGAANDIGLMRDAVVKLLGVPPEAVRVLAGWDPANEADRPTRDNILAALASLASTVRPGDRVFIQFSGHGSQQADQDGDEMDGLDEIFLPADVDAMPKRGDGGGVPGAITDDEFNARVRAIRDAGARVWVVMDCCHSGTMLRGGPQPVRFRALDPSLLGVELPFRSATRAAAEDEKKEDLRGIVAMYGAQSSRQAPEFPLPKDRSDARDHGLLTFTIATQLARLSTDVTFEEFFARVLAGYQVVYKATVPQAEGDLREMTVRGGAAAGGPQLLLSGTPGGTVLNAGTLAGIAEGAVLEVFWPGGLGDPTARLGFARVKSAGMAESACESLMRSGVSMPALAGDLAVCPARLAESPLEGVPLRLSIRGADGVAAGPEVLPREAREALEDPEARRKYPIVTGPAEADWVVTVAPKGCWSRLRTPRAARGPSWRTARR
jgi:hypothetical protein